MSFPVRDILGILSDNLRLRESVLPLPKRQMTAWSNGLGIKRGGETIIYTGHMYQLIPSIRLLASKMGKFEGSAAARYSWMARIANRFIDLGWLTGKISPREQGKYDEILRNIVKLLRRTGVDFGYLYDDELYSGALAFDQGLGELFITHAQKVYRLLKKNGVRHIITLDPHTTNMLRSVYPKLIDGYDISVNTYLEVLVKADITAQHPLDLDIVMHDSCIYARCEGLADKPRFLLKKAGARIHEPELSGRLTHCCGGPIESLFPGKAHDIAKRRLEQLGGCSKNITAMCPICMVNLEDAKKGDIVIKDISEHLVNAYCKRN